MAQMQEQTAELKADKTASQSDQIVDILNTEEERFYETLETGAEILDKALVDSGASKAETSNAQDKKLSSEVGNATPDKPATKDAASAKAAPPAPANPGQETLPDDELQALIENVKATITNSLDEQNFDKQFRKHIKKIKGWQDWSEHAKSAFAHMWAAHFLHNKAVDIKKDNEMDFTPVTGDAYKKLVRSLTHRVRF